MDKPRLELYASYKIEAAILEKKMEELKPLIIEEMIANEAEKVNTDWGAFTLQQNRKWTFSDEVEGIRTELKDKEAKEKATGTATYEETPILKFIQKKDKEDIAS